MFNWKVLGQQRHVYNCIAPLFVLTIWLTRRLVVVVQRKKKGNPVLETDA